VQLVFAVVATMAFILILFRHRTVVRDIHEYNRRLLIDILLVTMGFELLFDSLAELDHKGPYAEWFQVMALVTRGMLMAGALALAGSVIWPTGPGQRQGGRRAPL
jgi:uncharacterized membrane protein YadS